MNFEEFFSKYGDSLFYAYPKAKESGTGESFVEWVLNEYDYYLNTCTEYEVPYTGLFD